MGALGRDFSEDFGITWGDAEEFFESTPGILRAFAHPEHFDSLSFASQSIIRCRMGCKSICGELEAANLERSATVDTQLGASACGCHSKTLLTMPSQIGLQPL